MDENLPNDIDQIFSDGLQKYKVRPSEDIWSKIENRLEEDDQKAAWLSFGWKRFAAIAILLISLGSLATIYFHPAAYPKRDSGAREKNRIPNSTVTNKALSKSIDNTEITAKTFNDQNQNPVSRSLNQRFEPVIDNTDDLQWQMNPMQSESLQLQTLHQEETASARNKIQDQPTATLIHLKTRFRDRLSITPYFSQEFAGYSLTDNDQTGAHGQEIEGRERNVFSASVGFYMNYKINKKWVFQSGLSYSWSNSNIDSAISYAVKDNQGSVQFKLNTISGYGYLRPATTIQPNVGDSVLTAKSYSQLHYLTIPLVLSYRIPLNRFSLLIGAGGSFNVLTSAQLETKTYGNGNPEKEYIVNMLGLKKINYGILVKLDLQYHINSKMGIDIMPCFKNTLSPINLQTPVTAYPYNVGIGMGVTYQF